MEQPRDAAPVGMAGDIFPGRWDRIKEVSIPSVSGQLVRVGVLVAGKAGAGKPSPSIQTPLAFQSPRCRGSRCGIRNVGLPTTTMPPFQSPRCRGSRCGLRKNRWIRGNFATMVSIPSVSGQLVREGDRFTNAFWRVYVSIPSVSGQLVRVAGTGDGARERAPGVSIPSVSGQLVRDYIVPVGERISIYKFQSPRCRGS